jgi:hypothetical protein
MKQPRCLIYKNITEVKIYLLPVIKEGYIKTKILFFANLFSDWNWHNSILT